MAQTTGRVIIRRNIRLAGGKHLIFDREDDLWRVAFYRPRRKTDVDHRMSYDLQNKMEVAGMLETMPRNFWYRAVGKGANLDAVIFDALYRSDNENLHAEIIAYIKGMDYAWYLEN
jgi:hypothetical protein